MFVLCYPSWLAAVRRSQEPSGVRQKVSALCTPPCAIAERELDSWGYTGAFHVTAVMDSRLLLPPGTEGQFTLCLEAASSHAMIYLIIPNI